MFDYKGMTKNRQQFGAMLTITLSVISTNY